MKLYTGVKYISTNIQYFPTNSLNNRANCQNAQYLPTTISNTKQANHLAIST